MDKFIIKSKFKPAGDQPKAIKSIQQGVVNNKKHQVLLGATGTGKTFTIANVIANLNRTSIVLSHNKTLAGQLYVELKSLFPNNNVEYFISNFDYYKPEAYLPGSDTYIDKTAKSNKDIDAMRMASLNSLASKKPTIIVASVASIYGQINPNEYISSFLPIYIGKKINKSQFLIELTKRNYKRNQIELKIGTFRSKGDFIEIAPGWTDEYFIKIELFDDDIEVIKKIDPLTKKVIRKFDKFTIYPADAYTVSQDTINFAVKRIKEDLDERISFFKKQGKLLEKQRIEERIKKDINDLKEFGICSGVENYSRYFDRRNEGERPFTILDYIIYNATSNDYKPLMFIDESHLMIPQLNAMYNGDYSRKKNLVDYGFRLPSALDNRPLKFKEFVEKFDFQKIYVSATPGDYELDLTNGEIISQIVRPTGLIDPLIEIYGSINQIDKIYDCIQEQIVKKERTIILTITKKMAEELSRYLQERNIKSAYIHSEYKTFERDEIIRKLRIGIYDVIIGINLLKEGIDIPEVSRVLILDADKESFFRSKKALIQIIGRAARNVNGKVIMFANRKTKAMNEAIKETKQRREIQINFNKKHNITPKTIVKAIPKPLNPVEENNFINKIIRNKKNKVNDKEKQAIKKEINKIRGKMLYHARNLDYEKATKLRDLLIEIEALINK